MTIYDFMRNWYTFKGGRQLYQNCWCSLQERAGKGFYKERSCCPKVNGIQRELQKLSPLSKKWKIKQVCLLIDWDCSLRKKQVKRLTALWTGF